MRAVVDSELLVCWLWAFVNGGVSLERASWRPGSSNKVPAVLAPKLPAALRWGSRCGLVVVGEVDGGRRAVIPHFTVHHMLTSVVPVLFPGDPVAQTVLRGVPTAIDAPVLSGKFAGSDTPYVWKTKLRRRLEYTPRAHSGGARRIVPFREGIPVEPLHPMADQLARESSELYDLLALADALRLTSRRARSLARAHLDAHLVDLSRGYRQSGRQAG